MSKKVLKIIGHCGLLGETPMGLRIVHAFIDETGDRGDPKGKASPIFGMAAVLVEEGAPKERLNAAILQLRSDFGVPGDSVMSWKKHLKTHPRRRHAAEVLSKLEGVQILYVYADKRHLTEGGYGSDRERFYNYVAGKMFKAMLWAASYWQGGARDLYVKFGHVRGHDHETTRVYLRGALPNSEPNKVRWNLAKKLEWVSADKYLGSQAADLYAGFLKAALWPKDEKWGEMYYPEFLQIVWPQIRKGPDGCAIPLGILSMPHSKIFPNSEGFSCEVCKKKGS